MEIRIPYGDKVEVVRLEPDVRMTSLTGSFRPKKDLASLSRRLQEAVRDFLGTSPSLLIIVNDYTRPTPTSEILSILEKEIEKKAVYFLVALGSHRLPTPEEYQRIFGKFYSLYQERIVPHQAKEQAALKFFGKTSFSTPVWFNELLLRFPKIIAINSVEPHFFAGFTGGRKTFIPGVAGYETITINHKLSLSPKAKTLNLADNPVSLDMEESARMVSRPIFSIQALVDQKRELVDIKFGNLQESFLEGTEEAKGIFCLPVEEESDVVLACVQEPYDVDFYQSQKALENAKLGVREGGVIILTSPCRKGVGDDEFIRVMAKGKSPREVILEIERNFVLGAHKSAKLAEIVSRNEVLTVVPIEDDLVSSLFMKPMKSAGEAIDYCYNKFGKSFSLLFLPDASLVTPLVTG